MVGWEDGEVGRCMYCETMNFLYFRVLFYSTGFNRRLWDLFLDACVYIDAIHIPTNHIVMG